MAQITVTMPEEMVKSVDREVEEDYTLSNRSDAIRTALTSHFDLDPEEAE